MRVLIVDKDVSRRVILAHFLARQGCVPVQASDEQEANSLLAGCVIHHTIRQGELEGSNLSLDDFVDKTIRRFVVDSIAENVSEREYDDS